MGHSNPSHRNAGHGGGGQPDPMRTSVDSMAERGRRGGGGGFRNSGGGGYGGGAGGGRCNGGRGPGGGSRGSFNR
jgi:ATP-dependent RNA helicase RhlE